MLEKLVQGMPPNIVWMSWATLTRLSHRKPADLAILRALAIDSTDTQKKTMNSFPNIDSYVADFGFTPIHIAVLDFYDKADVHRPTLQDLIDFVDDANNAPVGNDWNTWRRFEVGLSPLYAEIVDMFRRAANTSPVKPLLNIIDQPSAPHFLFSICLFFLSASLRKVEVLTGLQGRKMGMATIPLGSLHRPSPKNANPNLQRRWPLHPFPYEKKHASHRSRVQAAVCSILRSLHLGRQPNSAWY